MLQFTSQQKLLLAVNKIDFRCGIDSLVALCKKTLSEDPFSGITFAFTNRKRSAVKLLMYDGNGFYLTLKRFSKGKLLWWPDDTQALLQVQAAALQVLLSQGDPRFMQTPLPWRRHSEDATQTFHAA